jgi:D-alanine--poly(phosphoribitol) ligase subunit 2
MALQELHHKIRQFLAGIDPYVASAVGPDTNLFETGLLDSMSLVQLVVFIEDTLNIEIPIGDFVLDSISSTESIYDHYVL